MAATGKTPILLYGSTTSTNVPTAGNLTNSSDGCEIAINVADKNLFFKDSTNAVNTVPIRQSSASSNGWLSSTDWSTFNGKQAALVSGTNIKTVNGTTLLGSGDVGTIGVGYGGTGTSTAFTAGSVVFAGASGVYTQNNSKFFWDNVNTRLGLGTASPAYQLDIYGTGAGGNQILGRLNAGADAFSNSVEFIFEPLVSGQTKTCIGSQREGAGTGAAVYLTAGGNEVLRGSVAGNVTVNTGNLVIGTSGKGIDFSATAGTGTSELLADYEEGTWTPTSGVGTATANSGRYTKVGRLVTVNGTITFPTQTNSAAAKITGLPFTVAGNNSAGSVGYSNYGAGLLLYLSSGSTEIELYSLAGGTITYTSISNARIDFTAIYFV